MKDFAIKIKSKYYPGVSEPVLKDLMISIKSGEFVSLVGPSGAGKTTLLNIIAGLDKNFSGQISTGADNNNEIISDHQSRVGYVFQTPRLLPWLTVEDNLKLVLHGEPGSDEPGDEEKIIHVLQSVGLETRRDSFPGALSGGMQRRVALARAFVIQPTLLLLDEPFVSVDAPTAERLRELLMTLWQETQPTVILVSHLLQEAIALADRVIFLSAGPAKVVHETSLDTARPRRPEDAQVVALHDRLLKEHPGLLSGQIGPSVETPDDVPENMVKIEK